jgi:penicillin amidase
MEIGQAAPMVAELTYEALRLKVAERAAKSAAKVYSNRFAPQAIVKLLRERPPDWFEDYDALLVEALAAGIDDGERQQGSRISRWDYGQMMRLEAPHPLFGRVPWLGRYFSVGPVAMSGSATTVKQMTRSLGPSFRMVVDLGNLDESQANVLTGQSGHPLSSHYKDQWDAYYSGTSFPMQFDRVTAEDTLTVRPLP